MNYKICPRCNQFNDIDAEICKWCRKKLAPAGKNICPNCQVIVDAEVKICPCCKSNINNTMENVCPECHSPNDNNLGICKVCGYDIKKDIDDHQKVTRIIEEHSRTNNGPLLIIGNKQIDPNVLNFFKKWRMFSTIFLIIVGISLSFQCITLIEVIQILKIILFIVAIGLLVVYLQKNSDNSKRKSKIFPIISAIIICFFLIEDYLPINFKDYSKKEIVTIKGYEIPTIYKYLDNQKAYWSLNVKSEADLTGKHSYISLIYAEEFNENSVNEYSDFLKSEGYELVFIDDEETIYQKKENDKYIQIKIQETSIAYVVTTGGI